MRKLVSTTRFFSSELCKPTLLFTRNPSRYTPSRAQIPIKYCIPQRCIASISSDKPKSSNNDTKGNKFFYATAIALAGSLSLSLGIYKKSNALNRAKTNNKQSNTTNETNDANKPNKPTSNRADDGQIFTRQEVAKHNKLENGVWITYKGNVYDITEFVRHHPGGSHTILMGAGGDVEPFWQTYTVHHAIEVQRLLSQYKIGQLTQEELEQERQQAERNLSRGVDENNPYANDPLRNPLLRVHSEQPFNAETPAKLLVPTYLTPTDIFFVRNHLPVPEVDLDDYKLSVCCGTDGDPDNLNVLAEFTLDDLKTKFKSHSVDCVIQCSGNRRNDLKRLKEIKGLDWQVGAMGNARWTGVKLVDLLEFLQLDTSELIASKGIKHVQLEGLDSDMTGQSYAASISADYAFDPNKEVLLAYEMNGKPLTRDHGFPLRFVAPGVTGARNVKWLGKIILSKEESHGHWQRKDYKSFSPNVDMFHLDFERAISIQETPVQSAICDPAEGESVCLTKDKLASSLLLPVKGYAYSGGGKMIVRVDVSIDGGKNWITAKLNDVPTTCEELPDFTNRNQVFSWTRWSLDVPISEENLLENEGGQRGNKSIEILCRAFDSSYNSQPERAETIWNVRGVVNNSWHRVKINVNLQ